MRAVIEALQALRGIALVSAVTIVAEVGELSRFAQAATADGLQRGRGERGFERRADPARRDHQDGQRASAARRRRSGLGLSASAGGGPALRKRQATVSAEVKEIAWKAQHRLHAPLPRAARRAANVNSKW